MVAKLGEGGMGEVYRARDSKLHRDVAIKVLPDAFAADPDRLIRFERESQVLASLNHSHIAQIYGVEESGATRALVMELVEGQTLAEMMPRLTIDDIVSIARQIASALEAAHDHGVIHRDLKPANVMVRDDGTVKILDFGLAKAFDASGGSNVDAMNSPTLTVHATQMGVVIGTAAYMAPEQARGKAVDRRADIWAFGVVLYEMLANVRAFEGNTVSDTMAAVLTKEPDWSKVRTDAPPFLIQLARRCLRKDPQRRLQAIGDARLATEDGAERNTIESSAVVDRVPAWHWARTVALVAVAAGTGAMVTWSYAPRAVLTPHTLPMHLAVDVPLALEEAPAFALSRDAAMLAFVGGSSSSRKLYVRRLDAAVATPVAGTDGASSPFFSPDGQWLAFVSNDSLKKVRISGGGPPIRLAIATDRGGVWTDDDTIIYVQARAGGLFQIPADGGTPRELTRADATAASHRFPTLVREKPAVLFTGRGHTQSAPVIFALDLKTGTQTTVLAGAYHPVYWEPGRLLFMRDSVLFSAPFDVGRLTITGPEVKVTDALRSIPDVMSAQFTATSKILLYQPGAVAHDASVIVWRGTDGREQPFLTDPDTYRDPRFSPDGRRLAYSVLPPGAGTDLWVFDRTRGLKTRLTYEASIPEWWPAWTPDGSAIAYSDNENGIRLIRADGSGDRQVLTQNTQQWQVPMSFSPGAKHLAYTELNRETHGDIWVLPLAPKGEPQPFVKTPFHEHFPMFSPNGRWIAYGSNESGTFEVYVRPFPGPGPKYQISGDQSFDVHEWTADGTKLFYRSGDGRRMMSVPVRTDRTEFEFGKPSVLFELDPEQYPEMQFWGSFSAAPDGSGFALVKRLQPDSSARTHLMVMLDWNR